MDNERESIWSVPAGLTKGYFIVFTCLIALSAVILALRTSYESDNLLDRWIEFLQGFGSIALAIAAISIVIADIGEWIMVTARVFNEWRTKRQQQQVKQARQEAEIRLAKRLRAMSDSERLSEIERVANGDK